jgi:hypothetical protein
MAKGPYSRIVIKRPSGRTEIVGRHGLMDPARVAREFSAFGQVVAVRHENSEGGAKPTTLAIHDLATGRR